MSTEISQKVETVTIDKEDFLAAWKLLNLMVVSNRKIGSSFALPVGQKPTSEHQQQMNQALLDYFSPDFFQEIGRVRSIFNQYIDNDEAEAISDTLKYWEPPKPESKKQQD